MTVRSALYMRQLYRFYFTLAVFYVTLGLFMSLFVRLGRIISIFWVYKNLLYYWAGFSGHFLSFTLVLVIYDASFL